MHTRCGVLAKDDWVRSHSDAPAFFEGQDHDAREITLHQTVRVRRDECSFTDGNSYPHVSVMIDSKKAFEGMNYGAMWGYIIVSRDAKAICCVKIDTRASWIEERRDGEKVYTAPKKDCKFIKLPDLKRQSDLLDSVIEHFDPVEVR